MLILRIELVFLMVLKINVFAYHSERCKLDGFPFDHLKDHASRDIVGSIIEFSPHTNYLTRQRGITCIAAVMIVAMDVLCASSNISLHVCSDDEGFLYS